MNKKLKIGILRETKIPPDRRVPFTPGQITQLINRFGSLEMVVQPSEIRCFSGQEYVEAGVFMEDDLASCEILMGVKEVDKDTLIPGEKYMFFSHTGKKQLHNRLLLQEIVARRITLIDYEYLADKNNIRLVAFGYWAGIVGAYNGLRAYGERYRLYLLKPAHRCLDLAEVKEELKKVKLPPVKILITGGGRVAGGAMEIFSSLGLKEAKPEEFLTGDFNEPVFCRIDPWHYVKRNDGKDFDLQHFFDHPESYEGIFKPYTKKTDIFVACHYWDPRSPVFMSHSDMREPGFKIRVIADVSCDLNGPIPSTIRVSTIEKPFYGFDPHAEREIPPFELRGVTVMAVDNLPGELPRDASEDFGKMLMKKVMPALIEGDADGIIERATIVNNGALTARFEYLRDYLEG